MRRRRQRTERPTATVRGLLAAALVLAAVGCRQEPRELRRTSAAGSQPELNVAVTELFPGPTTAAAATPIENPYGEDDQAIAEGRRLFDWMNCSGCHAPMGGGGMGPPLSDTTWVYGADPANVYLSIAQGRPNGMPAWGSRLSPDVIWKLTAYVKTLSEPETEPGDATGEPFPAEPDTTGADDSRRQEAPVTRPAGQPAQDQGESPGDADTARAGAAPPRQPPRAAPGPPAPDTTPSPRPSPPAETAPGAGGANEGSAAPSGRDPGTTS